MPSSTSSSEPAPLAGAAVGRAPARPWLAIWTAALLLALSSFGAAEAFWRASGVSPTVADDLNDTSVRGFAAAQLDDGGVDVAMLAHNLQGGRVRIFRNGGLVPDPTAHFNLPPKWVTGDSLSYETPSYDLADMNGNGRADLVLIDSNEVRVMLSLGGAEFIPSKRRVPSPPASQVVTGDFDGDGARDMVTVVPDGSALTVLLARP